MISKKGMNQLFVWQVIVGIFTLIACLFQFLILGSILMLVFLVLTGISWFSRNKLKRTREHVNLLQSRLNSWLLNGELANFDNPFEWLQELGQLQNLLLTKGEEPLAKIDLAEMKFSLVMKMERKLYDRWNRARRNPCYERWMVFSTMKKWEPFLSADFGLIVLLIKEELLQDEKSRERGDLCCG